MKRSETKSDRTVVLPGQMDLFTEATVCNPPQMAAVEVQTKSLVPVTPEMSARSPGAEPASAPLKPVFEGPRLAQRRPRREPGRLLDVAAAADYVGLSPSTLNKMRCLGEEPKFLKLTRSAARYDPADLDAWLLARKRASTAEV